MPRVGRISGRYRAIPEKEMQPVSVIRGEIDQIFDALGLPRPSEAIPTPADFVASLGLPTLEEVLPTPKEVIETVNERLRVGAPVIPGLRTPRRILEEW